VAEGFDNIDNNRLLNFQSPFRKIMISHNASVMTGSSFHLSAGMRGPDLPHACAGGEEHAAWPGSHAAHAPAHECPLCAT
jgi:hypothetical protein